MSFLNKKLNKQKGFTLIEMMVFMFIISIAILTFFKAFSSGTKAMGNVRNRLDALAIANQTMEAIHNLEYDKIGTINGVPSGLLQQDKSVLQDSKTFYVHTSVIYIDDPFDGTIAQGTDSNPDDYKQIRIQVYWVQNNPAESVTLVSNITPPGLESVFTGGILSLHVMDNSGMGIPNAQVSLTNNSVSPNVNVALNTDSQGNLFLPEAPPANQTYSIQISKSGYFPVQTYAPYPTSTVFPVDVHASVVAGTINQKTIVTDKISTINIKTATPIGVQVPNIDFGLTGGRKIADTASSPSQPVYAYNQSLNSGSDAQTSLANMSSGVYTLTFGNSTNNSNYVFLKMSNATTANNVFSVDPGTTDNETALVADKNLDSLLVTVDDSTTNLPIVNATVELKDPNSSYDVTLTTDNFGQVYFPDTSAPLVNGIQYQMSVSATGYASETGKNVTINKLTTQTVNLSAN